MEPQKTRVEAAAMRSQSGSMYISPSLSRLESPQYHYFFILFFHGLIYFYLLTIEIILDKYYKSIDGGKNKFRTILRHSSDSPVCQELSSPLCEGLSEQCNFEFIIAVWMQILLYGCRYF